MSEILVAVDGSPHSEKVVDYATGLAKSISAKIVLAYVVPEVSIPEEYEEYAKEERVEIGGYYEEVAERIIGDLGERISRQGIKYDGLHGFGNPARFLLETAQSRKVSLIVVGVHGLHRLGRLRALGSTARKIIENAPVPVVAVP